MNINSLRLKEKLLKRAARVSVIGQGYIGLPLALLLANSGFKVTGYDVNSELVKELSRGETRLENETGVRDLLMKNLGVNYFPTSDPRELMESDVVIIAVPTPKRDGFIDLSMLLHALKLSLSSVKRGGLVVVESTLPPKSFENLVLSEIAKFGMRIGGDIFASYCPERAMPGKLIEELVRSYRVIGAVDEDSAELSKALYESFVEGEIEVTDPLTAEIVKLVENSYRDVNIAFANEVARVCEVLGADVRRVRELANKHPRVSMLMPGIGVGGSCLTKDPLFLYWIAKDMGYPPELISLARRINQSMPYHYAELIDEFVRSKKSGKGVVSILGLTYKGDVPDTRESPAGNLVRELIRRGHLVKVYDPIVSEHFGAQYFREFEEAVKGADVVVIASDHSEFKKLDLRKLRALAGEDPVLLFDGKLLLDADEAEASGFIYASVGNIASLINIVSRKLSKVGEIISNIPE